MWRHSPRRENENQERQGILTIWDCYTRLEGYCLQFDPSEVDVLLQQEFIRRNYALLELSPVQYGLDEPDSEYQALLSR
jgi:hypothetical protein